MNINELLERYELKTRQSLYNRLKALNIILEKDSSGKNYATETQIQLLDDLNEHIKSGGTLTNYTETVYPEIDTLLDSKIDSRIVPVSSGEKTPIQLELFDLVGAIASLSKQQQSPLQNLRELQEAADRGWILTTTQVHQLTGSKPTGAQWVRGSFRFLKGGKIGAQAGWKVEKI